VRSICKENNRVVPSTSSRVRFDTLSRKRLPRYVEDSYCIVARMRKNYLRCKRAKPVLRSDFSSSITCLLASDRTQDSSHSDVSLETTREHSDSQFRTLLQDLSLHLSLNAAASFGRESLERNLRDYR